VANSIEWCAVSGGPEMVPDRPQKTGSLAPVEMSSRPDLQQGGRRPVMAGPEIPDAYTADSRSLTAYIGLAAGGRVHVRARAERRTDDLREADQLVGALARPVTSVCAIGALVSLWYRRIRWARAAAIGQVTCILVGWGLAQYPYLVLPDLTLSNAATARSTLQALESAVAVGAVVLCATSRSARAPRGALNRLRPTERC